MIKSWFTFLVFLGFLCSPFVFQNCESSKVNFAPLNPPTPSDEMTSQNETENNAKNFFSQTERSAGGNGEGYDYKLKNYYHFDEDFLCEGEAHPRAMITVSEDLKEATLSIFSEENCEPQDSSVEYQSLQIAQHSRAALAFEGNLFVYLDIPIEQWKDNSLVPKSSPIEAWCYDYSSPASGIETLITKDNFILEARVYLGPLLPTYNFSNLQETISSGLLNFNTNNYNLDIINPFDVITDSQYQGLLRIPGVFDPNVSLKCIHSKRSQFNNYEPKNLGFEVVATLYSQTQPGQPVICKTGSSLDGQSQGLFDQASYGTCTNNNPLCDNSRKVVFNYFRNPSNEIVKYHPACIKTTSSPSSIVALIYSGTLNNGQKFCHTENNFIQNNYLTFDNGDYSECNGTEPKCKNGSLPIVFSQFINANGDESVHTACLKNTSPYKGLRYLASIYQRVDSNGNKTCSTAASPLTTEFELFDENEYSECDSDGEPFCKKGSQLTILSRGLRPDNSVINYFTCVATHSRSPSHLVANIFSERESADNSQTCIDASAQVAIDAGYFDLGNYGICQDTNPKCVNGSKMLVFSQTMNTPTKTKFHHVCIK